MDGYHIFELSSYWYLTIVKRAGVLSVLLLFLPNVNAKLLRWSLAGSLVLMGMERRPLVIPQHSCILPCFSSPWCWLLQSLSFTLAHAANPSCSIHNCSMCWSSHKLFFCIRSPNPVLGCRASSSYRLISKAQTP